MIQIKRSTSNLLNLISACILIGMTLLCFFLWTKGIGTQGMFNIYANMNRYMPIGATIVLLLNVYRLKLGDLIWIGVGILSILFFHQFDELRQAGFLQDITIALIILIVLDFKLVEFTKELRLIFAGLMGMVLLITAYRIFTEIPDPVAGMSIWDKSNKLQEIWINTNTIGSSVMCSSFLAATLLQSLERSWARILKYPVYLVALACTWVVQSQAAFIAVVVFVLFDVWPNFLKEKVKWGYGIGYSVFLIGIFPLSLFLANSSSIDLFTGREDIWKHFYDTLFEVKEQFLVGMPPFTFQRGQQILGNHNSYNATLGQFGLVGLVLMSMFILYNVWLIIVKEDTQATQLSFIIAFFAVLMQSTMEDTLMAPYWIPITFCLLGLAWQKNPIDEDFYDYSVNVFDPTEEEAFEVRPTRKSRRG
ncbi:EpaQ family protein [Enterococcus malodoratus]|uniref:EpaQ family protein n=1 Tax=Enterococcus malodoratus TaxID=71451 RepID=UPI0039B03E02